MIAIHHSQRVPEETFHTVIPTVWPGGTSCNEGKRTGEDSAMRQRFRECHPLILTAGRFDGDNYLILFGGHILILVFNHQKQTLPNMKRLNCFFVERISDPHHAGTRKRSG